MKDYKMKINRKIIVTALVLSLLGCSNQLPDQNSREYGEYLTQMALKVEKGDEVSFIKLLKIFETLDGGALSDGLVAAGMFFEQNPKRFIKLTRKHNTRPDLVINSISRTPWYTVDRFDLKKSVLKNRLNILEIHKNQIDEQIYKSTISEINRRISDYDKYQNEY